jgi:uncharacterized protein (TIGR03790 family)
MNLRGLLRVFVIITFIAGFAPGPIQALEAEEVLVVVNQRMAGGEALARYYMNKRQIPENNLLRLSLTLEETMSREEFDAVLKKKVASAIARRKPERTEAVVLLYGVPLKVEAPLPTWEEVEELQRLRREEGKVAKERTTGVDTFATMKTDIKGRIEALLKHDQRASVDSELALVKRKASYPLSGWLENPFFLGFQGQELTISRGEVVLVCRLDGPDEATVRRLIDDSLEAEKNGLQGRACFDARWPRPTESVGLGGYQRYDLSLHRAAEVAAQRLPTTLDSREELFSDGDCPNAALYAGWYSLGRYVDAFSWSRGAIAYHIASSECTTLRDKTSSAWCINLLARGVAATIGPVHEPYVQAFPLPELFFGLLLQGHLSLGEAYLVSLPFLSWQMVLVGDPLYRPFAPLP